MYGDATLGAAALPPSGYRGDVDESEGARIEEFKHPVAQSEEGKRPYANGRWQTTLRKRKMANDPTNSQDISLSHHTSRGGAGGETRYCP